MPKERGLSAYSHLPHVLVHVAASLQDLQPYGIPTASKSKPFVSSHMHKMSDKHGPGKHLE